MFINCWNWKLSHVNDVLLATNNYKVYEGVGVDSVVYVSSDRLFMLQYLTCKSTDYSRSCD